jgi:PqqD family protein of HPr-rel-A system
LSSSSPRRWSVPGGLVPSSYPDSDSCLVFHPGSGDIHLITPAAYRLLQIASVAPATTDRLIAQLAEDLDQAMDSDFIQAGLEAIRSMDRAGLLRPIDS